MSTPRRPVPAPDERLAEALDAAERELEAGRDRWPATVALLAAISVGVSFLLPWRIGGPTGVTLARAGYADHPALLVWCGVALVATAGGLWPGRRARLLSSVVAAVAGSAIWYLAIQVATTEVVDEGRSLFSRRALATGPGPALAVLAATVLLAAVVARLVPVVLHLVRPGSPDPEFSEYELRDAVRRLRATRADRPVEQPKLD